MRTGNDKLSLEHSVFKEPQLFGSFCLVLELRSELWWNYEGLEITRTCPGQGREHGPAQESSDRTGDSQTGPSRMPTLKEPSEEKEPIMPKKRQRRAGEPGKTVREAK